MHRRSYGGAAAHIVKAVAEKRGWKHSNHKELFRIVDKIASEMNDEEIRDLFSIASSLHQNFYENWMPPKFVKGRLKAIKTFIEKNEKIRGI